MALGLGSSLTGGFKKGVAPWSNTYSVETDGSGLARRVSSSTWDSTPRPILTPGIRQGRLTVQVEESPREPGITWHWWARPGAT